MNADHIKYLKTIVEDVIVDQSGHNIFKNKFLEIYPDAITLKRDIPCACLRHLPGKSKQEEKYHERSIDKTNSEVTLTKCYLDVDYNYQIDFYTRDIYQIIKDLGQVNNFKTFQEQFVDYVMQNQYIKGHDNRTIRVEVGITGFIDDKNIIVDNIYKGFCKIKFYDGIYFTEKLPSITGFNLNEGGLK